MADKGGGQVRLYPPSTHRHPDGDQDPDDDAKSLPGQAKSGLRDWVLTCVRMTVCVVCAWDNPPLPDRGEVPERAARRG